MSKRKRGLPRKTKTAEKLTIHFDNLPAFEQPVILFMWDDADEPAVKNPTSQDDFGVVFEILIEKDAPVGFEFRDAAAGDGPNSGFTYGMASAHAGQISEVWCRTWNAFVYVERPAPIQDRGAGEVVADLELVDNLFVSDSGGRFALGASPLKEGGVLFGLFHPHASRVFVAGDFNDWQVPGADKADESKFRELQLHRGYFDAPNVWLLKVDDAQPGQDYKFYIEHQSLVGEHVRGGQMTVDPYARFLGQDFGSNNGLIVDPSNFEWHDGDYGTPAIHDLIIYELHVHGLTHDHSAVKPENQGRYDGIVDMIEGGYFDKLGITCLYLMPIAETPTPQGETALGYNSALFMAIERDFGDPEDLRRLVDVAHQHGLAVIVDQVFNHAANSWNPLWQLILDHPDDSLRGEEGGLYFSGESPWGNRIATERTETQNMLIDACKLFMVEYHIDGFRFDATHTHYMDHGFVLRLADELQALKPNVILIAENLPNQEDLNREGYNGFGQWNDFFHDTMKAFLREGKFEGTDDHPENLGDVFYFSKGKFAAHTNNVVNYVESHDEHSVAHEVGFIHELSSDGARERKARLGLMATMVALGQPMIYMGQEFGTHRERNLVYFDFPEFYENHTFFKWASGLITLRRHFPALKLHGYSPIEDGKFEWLLGPWLGEGQGGGKRILGWRSTPTEDPREHCVVLLNFENHPVDVQINFGQPGIWMGLATIDEVLDLKNNPLDVNQADDPRVLPLPNGAIDSFVLPDSSGFVYTWFGPLED